MTAVRTLCRAAVILLVGAAAATWYACSDQAPEIAAGPATAPRIPIADLRLAVAVQARYTDKLLAMPGVVGTAVTLLPDGHPGVQVLLQRGGVKGLPDTLEGVPVVTQVTGLLMAFSDPTKRARPAPMGFSVGHPAITAGTIGARVRDATGRVFILSNNHVLANSNGATIGDAEYQPGPFDGGTAADQIGTLADFQVITFSQVANNTIDAAIALSTTAVLDNATPGDDAYGQPNSTMWGDTNHDGVFDDRNALLGLHVQKYGRTTRLTHGQITGVNATVQICYEASGITCNKFARYVDQVIITPGGFSGGGDSGSLIVTDDDNLNPVALLFAGSSSQTIGNRIDLVLNRFGVTIDGFDPPPPGPFTDVAVTGVGAPATAVVDATTNVSVTVKNRGNQDVTSSFDITLADSLEGTTATQTVAGLAVGATSVVTFAWTPHATGTHPLVAHQLLADDRAINDQDSVAVTVNPPLTDVAVTTITAPGGVIEGHSANVAVTVTNAGNQPVGATFSVTLEDTTAGITLGSQTVTGLGVGATVTRTFVWNTTGLALGAHTLVARHDFPDDNAANDRRAVITSVNPKPTDVALTSIAGPARVNQGDTAHIVVTLQNTGEQPVTTDFNVVLTDGTAGGITVAMQTVTGLALGAVDTVDLPWHTAGAAITGHTLFAAQMLPDNNPANNSRAIGIIVNPPLTADVAIANVTAPASVSQGQAVPVGVTVTNVGSQSAGNFVVTLTDSAAGTAIGNQTVTGLAIGASAILTFNWSTTGAALGGHTLVATHDLTDASAANNRRSTAVTVNPTVVDIAVASVSAPPSVTQGNAATIGVTVQNVGGEAVNASFDVVLTDATAGVTIGSQTLTALGAGASATLTFSWNTTGAALGGHTLVATHTLADANAANNQRQAAVTVNPRSVDVALTGITGPASVTQGDTAHFGVTVQNVGTADVTTSFAVVLTDATFGGVPVATHTVPSLAQGTSTTLDLAWNTAGAVMSGHTMIATQMLPDINAANNSRAIGIAVNAPSVHVGNLAASATSQGTTWSATVVVTVHDAAHRLVNGVLVRGSWGGPNTGECVTGDGGGNGTCTIVFASIPNATFLVAFAVNSLTCTGYVYKSGSNHDPDGSSNGTTVFVRRP